MNNKEYGIKLDADISKFTKKIKDAQTYTDEVMKQIKDSIKEPLEEVGDTTKSAFEEKIGVIAKLGEQLGTLTMQYADAVLQEGENSNSALNLKQQIKDLNVEMEKEGSEIARVGDALGGLYEEEETTNNETKKFSINLSNLFNRAKQGASGLEKTIDNSLKKGISNIKRFSLSLLGIQSAYSMISKAVHSYMVYDTQMSTKIQANWVALGAMFAPIVEKLIGLFQKLVAYVNVFWKAFTGKNLINIALKKVQKTANGTTKAVKSLNKELSNMDEITNLNFDQGGGDIDAGTGAGDYNIEDALKEIKNLKLNPELVKMLEDFGKWCKKIYNDYIIPIAKKLDEWNISLKDVILVAGGLYGAFKLAKIYNGISKIIGVSGGTTGLYGMLTVFGMLVDFALAKKLGDELATLSDALYDKKDAEEALGDTQVELMNTIKTQLKETQKLIDEGKTKDKDGNDLIEKKKELIREAKDNYYQFGKDVAEGKHRTQEQKDEMEKLAKQVEKISNTKWKADIDFRLKAIARDHKTQKIIDFLFGGMYGYMNDWNLFGIDVSNSHGHKFAKGNVAYQPTMAEFGEYAGARSNPEITAPQNMIRQTLSEALVDAIPQIKGGSGDTILYVNGRELARATYDDFQIEGNRLGGSGVAIRRVS